MTNVTIRVCLNVRVTHINIQSGNEQNKQYYSALNQLLDNIRLISEIHLVADPGSNQQQPQGGSWSNDQV